MHEPGGEWQRRALEDFRQWLDALGDDAPEPGEPDAADCDLRDLFAEFAALRQEIRLQNRGQARAGRELAAAAAARYETAAREVEHRGEALAAFEKRISRTAEDRCLVETLEVRDALVRGRDAAVRLRGRPRLFRRPPRDVDGVVEGYELAIRRFDRMLSRFEVRRVETVGRSFDSRGHARGGGAAGRRGRGRPGGRGASERVRPARRRAPSRRRRGEPARRTGVTRMAVSGDDTIIGIDLGTTNSEVAIITGGKPTIVEDRGEGRPALVRGTRRPRRRHRRAAGPQPGRGRPPSGRCSRSSG